MIVILAAGKATRMHGLNKLLVIADCDPVHEWHRRAVGDRACAVVVNSKHAQQVRSAAPWISKVVTHDKHDGPAGALLEFDKQSPHGALTVLFADTLLPRVPDTAGDWVGVAPAPWRAWDYYDRAAGWTRGTPSVLVCCGVYRFEDRDALRESLIEAMKPDGETHMADVLRSYAARRKLNELVVDGWQDAGDAEALKRVHKMR